MSNGVADEKYEFEEQGTVTWIGFPSVRPVGSTGKVREVGLDEQVYVSWGYDPDVPRGEQKDAEGWVSQGDLLPGFVPEQVARAIAGLLDAMESVMGCDKGQTEEEWIDWCNRYLPLMHQHGRERYVVEFG